LVLYEDLQAEVIGRKVSDSLPDRKMEVIHSRKAHIWTRPGRAAFGGTSVKQETESPSAGAMPRWEVECQGTLPDGTHYWYGDLGSRFDSPDGAAKEAGRRAVFDHAVVRVTREA